MKVLLVNISLRPDSPKLIFPIGLGYIATAVARAGFDFEILDLDAHRLSDAELERELAARDYDVAAFGCIVTGYSKAKALAAAIRRHRPEAPIIAGNTVASSVPELLLRNTEVDIAVMAEGNVTIVELLHALDAGRPLAEVAGIAFKDGDAIHATPARPVIRSIDDIPIIHHDLFDMEIYLEKSKHYVDEPYPLPFEDLRALPINTARGCPHACTFCYHAFRGVRYRTRSPQSVCREIEHLVDRYGINYVHFWDELTFHSRRQCEVFLDALLASDFHVYWTADCRADLFREQDLALARKAREAGCVGLGFSLESANREILKAMNKHLSPEDFVTQTHVLKRAGIVVWTSLVLGYPQETEETIAETFDLCRDNDIYPSAGYLLPQPGTPMYDYALAHGIITDEETYLMAMGDRQDLRVNFTHMHPDHMQALVREHLARINEKLELGLDSDRLIKTGHYRAKPAEPTQPAAP